MVYMKISGIIQEKFNELNDLLVYMSNVELRRWPGGEIPPPGDLMIKKCNGASVHPMQMTYI